MINVGDAVTVVDDMNPSGLVQTQVTHVYTNLPVVQFDVPSFSNEPGFSETFYAEEENTFWIRGHHSGESVEGRALLSAYALVTTGAHDE